MYCDICSSNGQIVYATWESACLITGWVGDANGRSKAYLCDACYGELPDHAEDDDDVSLDDIWIERKKQPAVGK